MINPNEKLWVIDVPTLNKIGKSIPQEKLQEILSTEELKKVLTLDEDNFNFLWRIKRPYKLSYANLKLAKPVKISFIDKMICHICDKLKGKAALRVICAIYFILKLKEKLL